MCMSKYSRPPITDETKRLMDERKPDGMTYDLFIRHALRTMDPLPTDRDRR